MFVDDLDVTMDLRSWETGAPPDVDSVRVGGRLMYDRADPYAVGFTIPEQAAIGQGATWFVGRELLRDGCEHGAGIGDVSVWPDTNRTPPARLWIRLATPEGICVASIHRLTVVRAWIRETYALVPDGAEARHMDVDGWVRRIMASNPRRRCARGYCPRCQAAAS